jgi:prepilin-type N-terminal cleavage/methylation domain-containing protein
MGGASSAGDRPWGAARLPLDRGFAIIEAMIAIVIMGIGLFGLARLNAVLLAGTAIGKTRAEFPPCPLSGKGVRFTFC